VGEGNGSDRTSSDIGFDHSSLTSGPKGILVISELDKILKIANKTLEPQRNKIKIALSSEK
jgi:hypothetical protein